MPRRVAGPLFLSAAMFSAVALAATMGYWLRHPGLTAGVEWETPGTVRAMTPAEMALPGYDFDRHETAALGLGVRTRTAFLHHDDHTRNGNGVEQVTFLLPYWFFVLITAILPTWWAVRFRRNYVRLQRAASGRCTNSGYDLRESAGRCPECGATDPRIA